MSLEKMPAPVLWIASGLLIMTVVAGVAYLVYDVWNRYG